VCFVTTLLLSAWPVHSPASPRIATQHLLLSAEAARALILWAECIRSRTVGVCAGDKALPCPTPCYKSVVRKNAQNTNKLRLIAFAAPFATFAAMLFAQTPPARIVQLSPAAIPGLPANLVKELERRGCTIPQEAPTKKSSNVIKGAFAKPGQTDWAALCSVNGGSTTLGFWKTSRK